MSNKIIFACDYRGIKLKDALFIKAKKTGLNVENIGVENGSPLDYVDITKILVEKLLNNPSAYGVLVCESGHGVALYANRHNNIRATVCLTAQDAKAARRKLNANVLCLGSKYTSADEGMDYLLTFLETPFNIEKHGKCASKLAVNVTEHAYNGINLIVRAIVIRDNHILLAKATEQNSEFSQENYFLPGGHVAYNESAIDAIQRELKEEISYDSTSAKFVGALECSWNRKGQPYHELNLVYFVDVPKLKFILDSPPISNEPFIKFVWKPLSKISNYKILPEKLINIIQQSSKGNSPLFFSEMKTI